MENASKALIIAGAILLSILIIAIGMFIYSSSQSAVDDSLQQMNTQQIGAFNSQFTIYGGNQTGSKLKSMIDTLIANANTYKEEPAKLPEVKVDQFSNKNNSNCEATRPEGGNENSLQTYITNLGNMRNNLENKHTYTVNFSYSTNGVLTGIEVIYDANSGSTSTNPTNP